MGLSSRRSSNSKGKASSPHLPLQLQQHLPRDARPLVSALSDDDREVLTYMLAFGLHLQMLAGVVFPAQKLQLKSWKSSSPSCSFSAAKAGLHRECIFAQSFYSLSYKSGIKPGKVSSLLAHKTSCSCDCFSCYSSFWSRWAASPNRDVLSKIIEMAEEEEGEKLEKTKESAKKQEKKHVLGNGAGGKGVKSKLSRGTLKSSLTLCPVMSTLSEPVTSPQSLHGAPVCAPMDTTCNAPWDYTNVNCAVHSLDDPVILLDMAPERSHTAPSTTDASTSCPLRVVWTSGDESPPMGPWDQHKTTTVLEDEVFGSFPTQALLEDPMQGKTNLRLCRTAKRKINQIMPLDFEATHTVKEDNNKLGQSNESGEGDESPRLMDVITRDGGVLSRVFPHPLCEIASRLWDLVSLGPRGHLMEHY